MIFIIFTTRPLDTPLELGCFKKPESVSSNHSGISNLTQEACILLCDDAGARLALLHKVSMRQSVTCLTV